MTHASQDFENLFGISYEDIKLCHNVLDDSIWQSLSNNRIFITGGTGFVGKWLLATLLHANANQNLNCKISVLSRDPSGFVAKWPELGSNVEWIQGDVRNFSVEKSFDVIVHAATDVIAQRTPEDTFSTCLDGTRNILSLAKQCGASKLLLISSGAVYGPPPENMTHIPETYLGAPDPLVSSSAYGEGKRVSELLAAQASKNGLEVKIARIFAVVGPHLPLDKHYAIGNFIDATLKEEDILVKGDGSPHRSYLYATDMAAWLWAILLKGASGRAYNVGSDESISIENLAWEVSKIFGNKSHVYVQKKPEPNAPISHYVPDISRVQNEFGLKPSFTLKEAIFRTGQWYINVSSK